MLHMPCMQFSVAPSAFIKAPAPAELDFCRSVCSLLAMLAMQEEVVPQAPFARHCSNSHSLEVLIEWSTPAPWLDTHLMSAPVALDKQKKLSLQQ